MSDFEYNTRDPFVDNCLTTDHPFVLPTLRRQASSEKFMIQVTQIPTQVPRQSIRPSTPIKQQPRLIQSNLHNCPKHLIKLIIQCIGLSKQTADEIAREHFNHFPPVVFEYIKNLLGMLEMIRRSKIKSYSKQLLKIVFQAGAENIDRLKHMENPMIGKLFQGVDKEGMDRAKEALREWTLDRLKEKKQMFGDRSKSNKKEINERYLQLFVEEMRQGRIKERISKEDKMRIFEGL